MFEGRDVRGYPHNVAERGIARTFQNIELFEHAGRCVHLGLQTNVIQLTRKGGMLLSLPANDVYEFQPRTSIQAILSLSSMPTRSASPERRKNRKLS